MDKMNRREFVGTAIAATGAVALGVSSETEADALPRPKSPSDKVKLGKTGVKLRTSRSAGTGGGAPSTTSL